MIGVDLLSKDKIELIFFVKLFQNLCVYLIFEFLIAFSFNNYLMLQNKQTLSFAVA